MLISTSISPMVRMVHQAINPGGATTGGGKFRSQTLRLSQSKTSNKSGTQGRQQQNETMGVKNADTKVPLAGDNGAQDG